MRLLRIAHVGKFKKASTNGVFQCIYNIAINQAKLGHDVFVYSLDDVDSIVTESIEGITVTIFPYIKIKGLNRFKGFILPKELKMRLKKNEDRIDVLHLHSVYTPYNTIISRIAVKSGIKYVLTPHGGYSKNCGNRSLISKAKKWLYDSLFEKKMIKDASMIHCVSQREKEDSQIGHDNIVVINNGVNIPSIRNNSCSNGNINMLFLGRIDIVHKGLDLLIDAFRLYKKDHPDTKLRIIIAGPSMGTDEQTLKELVNNYGLDACIRFIGTVLGKEKEILFEETANVFVHTSRWEGLPISILEALSYGIPVFVSKETNVGQYVKEYNAGWVLEELDTVSISKALLEIENSDLKETALNARQLAEECFSWDALVPELLRQYEKIMVER